MALGIRRPNFRHPDFKILAAIAALLLAAPLHCRGDDADDQIRSADKQVLEQVRQGNRDPQKLMKLMEPALKAHNQALEERAKAQLEENARLAKEHRGKSGGKTSGKPGAPATKTGETNRYASPVDTTAPIVDPSSVPRELTFGKGSDGPAEGALPAAVPTSGDRGVTEVQFDGPAKPAAAPSIKPASRRRGQKSD